MEKMRVDKWLWCVRIFKSRSQATDACKKGRVKINDQPIKPSAMVSPKTILQVRKDHFDLVFEVLALLKTRVSFTLAQPCYENLTPEEEYNKFKSWYIGKARPEIRDKGSGRPTKKERRELDEFKEDYFEDI